MRELLNFYKDDEIYFHHAVDKRPDSGFYSMHAHEHYELFFFISGKGKYMIEGAEYALEPGCFLIMRPAEAHSVLIDPSLPYERLVFEFSPEFIKPVDPGLSLLCAYNNRGIGEKNKYSRRDLPRSLPDCITDSCCGKAPREYTRFFLLSSVVTALSHINSAFKYKTEETRAELPRDISKELVDYINRHLFEDLSLQKLCERFYMSDSHLGRLFKAATGSSIAKYISIKRLIEARRKINEGVPASTAAKECGYNDYSSFYRAYRKRFGEPPCRIVNFTPLGTA